MTPQEPLQAPVGKLVFEVARVFRRRFEDEARAYDLTLPQWRALGELARQGGISQVTLAAAIDVTPMTMSGILDRLEKRNLIRREQAASDSRAKTVHLTDEGLVLFQAAKAVGVGLYQSAIEGLSPEQLDVLVEGLTLIRNNLNDLPTEQKEIA